MRFSTALFASGLLAGSALAAPPLASRQSQALTEDSPWKLTNIIIYDSISNSTGNLTTPSSVNFDIRDENEGLAFNTHCSRTVEKGGNLYDGQYRDCGPESAHLEWYLDSDKNVYIKRSYTDPAVGPPGMDYVTCFGNWQLNPHPFEVRSPKWSGPLQGTNYTQGCLEVYCTAMIA